MSRLRNVKNEKGMTLAEVLICMMIVAMVVGPITANFVMADKNRTTAMHITEATNNAETLMEQIKARITEDILLKQKIEDEGKTIKNSTTEKERYNKFCKAYIEGIKTKGASIFSSSITEALDPAGASDNRLARFLAQPEASFNTTYHTERYSYEVVIWPLYWAPDISGKKVNLVLDQANMTEDKRTMKLWTNSAYKLNGSEYATGSSSNPIRFDIDEAFLKAYKDATQKYVICAEENEKYKLLNHLKIKAKKESAVNDSYLLDISKHEADYRDDMTKVINTDSADVNNNKKLKDETKIIMTGNEVKGYEITIDISTRTTGTVDREVIDTILGYDTSSANRTYYNSNIKDLPYLNILDLDLSEFQSDNSYRDFIFKVINKTGYDMLVRVPSADVKGRYHFITENVKGAENKTGKTTIEYSDQYIPEENYVIAMVVRNIDPVTGTKGQIVKKMLQLYSYDPTTSERR